MAMIAAMSSHPGGFSLSDCAPAGARSRLRARSMLPDGDERQLGEADREWQCYDPDTDPYDVRTATVLPPVEDPAETTRKQIAALRRRIAREDGDPHVLDHYRGVLREMQSSMNDPAEFECNASAYCRRRLQRNSSETSDVVSTASTCCPETPPPSGVFCYPERWPAPMARPCQDVCKDQAQVTQATAAKQAEPTSHGSTWAALASTTGEWARSLGCEQTSRRRRSEAARFGRSTSQETDCWSMICSAFTSCRGRSGRSVLQGPCRRVTKNTSAFEQHSKALELALPSWRRNPCMLAGEFHDQEMGLFLAYF
eukprot:gb/GFBE01035556.1/.p1 GENE.gb/GFBE01035556.1/~~gb/GFBE01035556.1/.p1  ORF type:complete len:312 (+),score=20.44 gb/GFBE01035556.1/:1-936(+)